MTEEEVQNEKKKIDDMSQHEMAELWRFAPAGHPYFDRRSPLCEYFAKRFKGFTPELSKDIGLERP